MARKRRQRVTFTDEAAELVMEMAARKGLTVSEVVRRGVALESWLDSMSDAKILVQLPGEPAREVTFVG
jgi:ribosomal protein L14